MKITTYIIANLMTVILWLFSLNNSISYLCADCIANCEKFNAVYDAPRYLSEFYALWYIITIAGIVILFFYLYDSNKTLFYIPNPLESMIKAYKLKKEYIRELNNIYALMAKVDNDYELDRLIRKKEQLKDALKIHID